LETLVLTKITEAKERNTLLDDPFLTAILYLWEQLAGIEEPKQWIEQVVASDEGLLQLLVQFLSSEHSSNGQITTTRDRLDPERLKPYLDAEHIYARLQDVEQRYALTDEQLRAVRQYRKEYELRQEGKNPDFSYF
jgi:predicted KAP-like P-loop ATPase